MCYIINLVFKLFIGTILAQFTNNLGHLNGNYSKKGEYQWHAQIRRKGYTFETKTFNTKIEAETWSRSVENEMDRGVFASRAEAEGTTLYEALNRYEREISCKKKGFIQERYKIRVWQTHALAKRSLASLKGADFAKYRDERLASGSSAATVRLALALISHLYTIATKEWDIPVQNPVKNIRLPRENNSRERRLLDGEEATLLSCLEAPAGDRSNPWVRPLVILALESAMRQGELLSLEWKILIFSARSPVYQTPKMELPETCLCPVAQSL